MKVIIIIIIIILPSSGSEILVIFERALNYEQFLKVLDLNRSALVLSWKQRGFRLVPPPSTLFYSPPLLIRQIFSSCENRDRVLISPQT